MVIISVEFNLGSLEPHLNASKGRSDWKPVLLTWKLLHSEHCEDSVMSESFIFYCNVLSFSPKAATTAFEIANSRVAVCPWAVHLLVLNVTVLEVLSKCSKMLCTLMYWPKAKFGET